MNRQKKLRRKWQKRMDLINAPAQSIYHMTPYQRWLGRGFNRYMLRLQWTAGIKVLVIGCFNGMLLYEMDHYRPIKGYYIDQSPRLMKQAMHFYPHFSYQLFDGNRIPYKNNKFDVVICSIPLSCFQQRETILEEISRVAEQTVFFFDIHPFPNAVKLSRNIYLYEWKRKNGPSQ